MCNFRFGRIHFIFANKLILQLAIPEYLSEFLQWLFKQIRFQLTAKKFPAGYRIWSKPPIFSKFLGDGVLFLWDMESSTELTIMNTVTLMNNICVQYEKRFI